jgi:1-pyrroline-5-carboxylate dehydrogenase
MLDHPELSGIHFTGSTTVFRNLWKQTANKIDTYKSFPRLVGETGGKNMHFVHESANPENVVHNTIRSAFEYQGQKCSACSRAFIPDTLWPTIKPLLISEVSKIKVGSVQGIRVFQSVI